MPTLDGMDTDEEDRRDDREAAEEAELDERVATYLGRALPETTRDELKRRAREAREMGFLGVGTPRAGDHFTTGDRL